jgi:hypothetical protein
MTGCAERASRAMKDFNGENAERLLLHLYTGLPLLPAAEDGGRSAVLARFGPYEVRLTERWVSISDLRCRPGEHGDDHFASDSKTERFI